MNFWRLLAIGVFVRLKNKRLALSLQIQPSLLTPRSPLGTLRRRDEARERRLSCRLSRPLLVTSLIPFLFFSFSRDH